MHNLKVENYVLMNFLKTLSPGGSLSALQNCLKEVKERLLLKMKFHTLVT